MPVDVHRREFDVFLSYAHSDHDFVSGVHAFLVKAGLDVCFDETNIEPGSEFPQTIRQGIERSRGVLIVATEDSIGQGWVRQEVNMALDEHARDEDFRLIPLRIGDAPVDEVIRGLSWISLPHAELDRSSASAILRSFYPSERRPNPANSRDVYVSASWRDADAASAKEVSKRLIRQGFRLVGDSRDQEGFGGDRIERIVGSCGAFVCVLPFRNGIDTASADDSPYKYFLREIDIAAGLSLPSLVIADPRVSRSDGDDASWLRMDTHTDDMPDGVVESLEGLWHDWREPATPHFIFLATSLESEIAQPGSIERRLLELVTGMPTVVGNEVQADSVQLGITKRLAESHLVIADISGIDDETFNLDVSIEAGMALAFGANLRLMARGRERRPPFMLRARQMPTYETDVDRIAQLHSYARSFRRRIINAEM